MTKHCTLSKKMKNNSVLQRLYGAECKISCLGNNTENIRLLLSSILMKKTKKQKKLAVRKDTKLNFKSPEYVSSENYSFI